MDTGRGGGAGRGRGRGGPMRGRAGRGRGSFLGGGMMGMRAAPYGRGGRGGQVCDNCGQPGWWNHALPPSLESHDYTDFWRSLSGLPEP